MARSKRGGFTLVEALVVIAIAGVVVSLSAGVVQKVRSAADRASCSSNLRQLAFALLQRHDEFGRFPPGCEVPGGQPPMPFGSWHAKTLPYIGEGSLWKSSVEAYRLEPNSFINPPHVGLATAVRLFGCPADDRVASAQYVGGAARNRALTSYLGNEGTDVLARDGILFADSRVTLGDIADGTSFTLLLGERPPSTDKEFGWWYAGMGQWGTGSGDMILGVRERAISPSMNAVCGDGPYYFASVKTPRYCDLFHFWSLHDGGAQFAFADGSVHFVNYSADAVLPALATRNGGEPVEWP